MLPEIFLALQFYFSFDLNIITDEPLHPIVKEALQDQGPMPAYEDNAHVYLMGLVAGEGDDSFEVGKKRFIAMGETTENGTRQAYKLYPKERWAAISSEENLCNLEIGNTDYKKEHMACITKLKTSCDEQTSLIKQYRFLLDNYNEVFLASKAKSPSDSSMIDWDTLTVFRMTGVLDSYNRLYRSQCVSGVDKSALVQETEVRGKSLRALKAGTDDITANVMLLVKLKEFYRWQVYSYRNGLTELKKLPTAFFALQTKEESSLRKGLSRMIRDNAGRIEGVYQEILQDSEDEWILSFLFKRNLTINESARFLHNRIVNSELPITQYLHEYSSEKTYAYFKWWRMTNYLGGFLSVLGVPTYIDVTVDMNNLDLTIRLSDIVINYTELVDNNQLHDLPLTKRNPYDNSLPYFDESGQWLCFKVPEELKSQDECMYLH